MEKITRAVILRHRKENLKKCSLRGLEKREDFLFYTYPKKFPDDLKGFFILTINAPVLTKEDRGKGLLLIDGTWNLAQKMLANMPKYPGIEERSIPEGFITAYPRVQTGCSDPARGLASIEALYIAFKILGYPTDHLLDNYHFGNEFLQLNEHHFNSMSPQSQIE